MGFGSTLEACRLSLEVATAAVLITVPLALVAASLLYRSRWRALEIVFLLPLLLPPTVTGFLLLWLLSPLHPLGAALQSMGLRVVFTLGGTLLATVVVSFPLAFQACLVGLSRVPVQCLESARLQSGSRALDMVRVLWPQLPGALGAAALLVFARSMGEFGASMMVGGNQPGETQTLPLLIYSMAEVGRYQEAGLAAALTVVLGIVLYLGLRAVEVRHER